MSACFAIALGACGDDATSGADATPDTGSDALFDTGGGDTSAPDTTPADTAAPDTTPADTSTPDTSTPDTEPVDTTVPNDTVADTTPTDTVADTAPNDTGDDTSVPNDTVADTAPNDTVADTAPNDTVADTTPNDTVADTTPTDTVADTTPNDTVADTTPTDTVTDTGPGDVDPGDGSDAVDTDTSCVPDCIPGLCGEDDGCGGICGCEAGEFCSDLGLCEVSTDVGNTCDAPLTLELIDGDLYGAGDLFASGLTDEVQVGSCTLLGDDSVETTGIDTPDQVWSFTVPADGTYTIAVLSDFDTDVFYMLFEGPGCADAACLGYVDNGADGDFDFFDHELSAAKTYTLVIDTWATFAAGFYEVLVTPACTPVCEVGVCGDDDGCGGVCGCPFGETCDVGICVDDTGDTCLAPYEMIEDELGEFSEIGDLSLDTVDDDYALDACPLIDGFEENSGRGTPDEVFTFEITTPGLYAIGVLSDEGADVFFALFEGDLCDDSATCVGQVDNGGTGQIDGWIFDLPAGTYTLVVDAYLPETAGAYLVLVNPVEETCAPDLFFSEYVEGPGTTKVLEIYNGTGGDVSLGGYQIWRANNGATVADAGKFDLDDTILLDGETWSICNGQSDASFLATCDENAGDTLLANFNGNDYIALVKLDPTPTVIDAIGVEGEDPGVDGWAIGADGSTTDHVLWRLPEISEGNPDWSTAADEWDYLPATTIDETIDNADIGFHDTLWICTEAP